MSLITDSKALEKAIFELKAEEFIAIDTEFDRRSTYYPKLCLVQIAGKDNAFAIDVLAENLDLEPFHELLKNNETIKVFHSCREDIEALYHLYKIIPAPIFDTQVAAAILGFGESASYASLVETLLNEVIDKTHRYSDWSMRPLSKNQFEYALSDVTHLRKLYGLLKEMLIKGDKIDNINREMPKLLDVAKYVNNPEDSWKKFASERLSPVIFDKVRRIAKWREETAQRRDLPRQWVIKDGLVRKIAEVSSKESETKEDDVRKILQEAKVGRVFIDEIIKNFVRSEENV